MSATISREPSALLMWLNLLGWQIRINRSGELLTGVAYHGTSDGSVLEVSGTADTEAELSWQLFEAAMRTLEASRSGLRNRVAA
jgi:hypothetical protein